jgi:hypothetical protein
VSAFSMSRRRRTVILAVGAVTAAATLAACGDPIKSNVNWRSQATLTGVGTRNLTLQGPLLNAQGKVIPGTLFREVCAQIGPVGEPAPAYNCVVAINTGTNTYAASGDVAGPYGTLKSLATPVTFGTITITNLSSDQNTTRPLVQITAFKGPNGN